MAFVSGLKCRECGRENPTEPLNVCEFCFGPLEVVYDYATISEVISHKRIRRIAVPPLSGSTTSHHSQRVGLSCPGNRSSSREIPNEPEQIIFYTTRQREEVV